MYRIYEVFHQRFLVSEAWGFGPQVDAILERLLFKAALWKVDLKSLQNVWLRLKEYGMKKFRATEMCRYKLHN